MVVGKVRCWIVPHNIGRFESGLWSAVLKVKVGGQG